MENLIAEKSSPSLAEAQEEVRELRSDLDEANETISKLEEELKEAGTVFFVETNLGVIYFQNLTGNLRLQEEIEAFAEALKNKY